MASGSSVYTLSGSCHRVAKAEDTQLEVQVANRKQQVLIERCRGADIKISGRPNAVRIDHCSKCGIILEYAALLEVAASSRLELQAMDGVGRADFDGDSDITLHLPPQALANFSSRSTRSTEIKIVIVKGEGETKLIMVPASIETTFTQEGDASHVAVL